jgi:toxin ParE1/3/4
MIPVILRSAAERDIEQAVEYYVAEGSPEAALGLIDELEETFRLLSTHPGLGSQRYAELLSIPGLHSRGLRCYPHVVFYLQRQDHVDVWRVLHGKRDIPETLRLVP